MILFGPQAGRKDGVAPALLTYLPAYRFCGPDFVLFVRSRVTESRAENRPENRKENRVQLGFLLFSTVSVLLSEARFPGSECPDSGDT